VGIGLADSVYAGADSSLLNQAMTRPGKILRRAGQIQDNQTAL
jgi:hypothetical protein